MPEAFAAVVESPNLGALPGWILGRWWFVRPQRVQLILDSAGRRGHPKSWQRRAKDAGVLWMLDPAVQMEVGGTPSHKVAVVDLFRLADSLSMHGLSPRAREHLNGLGYRPPRPKEN